LEWDLENLWDLEAIIRWWYYPSWIY
jgi:hypothetical protein